MPRFAYSSGCTEHTWLCRWVSDLIITVIVIIRRIELPLHVMKPSHVEHEASRRGDEHEVRQPVLPLDVVVLACEAVAVRGKEVALEGTKARSTASVVPRVPRVVVLVIISC